VKECWVSYKKVRGIYHIDLTINGEWSGGGNTGCNNYNEAYNYACKVAKTKEAHVERFYKK